MLDWNSEEDFKIEDILMDYDLKNIEPGENFTLLEGYYLDIFDVEVGLIDSNGIIKLFFSHEGNGFPPPFCSFIDMKDNYIHYCYDWPYTEEDFLTIVDKYVDDEKVVIELVKLIIPTKLDKIMEGYGCYFKVRDCGEYSVIYKHRLREFNCEVGLYIVQCSPFIFFSREISCESITPPNYDYFNYLNYIFLWPNEKRKFIDIVEKYSTNEELMVRKLSQVIDKRID